MGADPTIDIIDFYPMFSCKHAADLLILRVFLVASTWVAVKGEERVFWIMDREMFFFKVFDNICATEITGDPYIDRDIDDIVYCRSGLAMNFKDFLDDCFPHGPFFSSVFSNRSSVLSHII